MSQFAVHFQTAPTQSWKLATHTVAVEDTLLYPSHNTPHSSFVKSQVQHYIRHKWVIDKSLATPPSFSTPSIQHLTCVSYLFNIRLAPCPVHHITPDCWTFRPEPLNLSSMRWSKGWDTTARIVYVRDHECVCVCVCVFSHCVPVFSLMCLISCVTGISRLWNSGALRMRDGERLFHAVIMHYEVIWPRVNRKTEAQ